MTTYRLRRLCVLALLPLSICPSEASAQAVPTEMFEKKNPTTQDLQTALSALRARQKTLQTQQEARLAALETRIGQLQDDAQKGRLDLIRIKAEAAAQNAGRVTQQADAEGDTTAKTYQGGQRALQALNPEVSIVGDAVAQLIINEDFRVGQSDRSGAFFRVAGLHLEAALDPMSLMKVAVAITPAGLDLEEAYITWTSILPGVAITLGRFRQQFGVVNRWHPPSLDQLNYPLAVTTVLGPDGLTQSGLAVDWFMPAFVSDATHLMLQVTNGDNPHLFAGEFFSIPSVLVRTTNYWDLTEATYLELGISAMVGPNNARGRPVDEAGTPQNEGWRSTWVWGADWTVSWVPTGKEKYLGILFRGEAFGARKDLGCRVISTWGLYQYLHARVSRRFEVGARFDLAKPFEATGSESPSKYRWAAVPYIAWWQSPWVRVRLEYAFSKNGPLTENDHRVVLQTTFAAGPHKHERY